MANGGLILWQLYTRTPLLVLFRSVLSHILKNAGVASYNTCGTDVM